MLRSSCSKQGGSKQLPSEKLWLPLSIQAGLCAALFMYFGCLFREAEGAVRRLPREVLIAAFISAAVVWVTFLLDFKGFYLVNNRFAVADVWRSLCACLVVLIISRFIEKKSRFLTKILTFYGKNSLFVLCAHIIELNLFPWSILYALPELAGLPHFAVQLIELAGKAAWITALTLAASKCPAVRALFGMKREEKKAI